MSSKKILIFGGSGYVGSKLIVELLKNKFEIINYDLNLYGKNHLPFNKKKFKQITGNIRNVKKITHVVKNYKPDTIIHLACISNDPSFLLDKKLSKEVNFDSFVGLMRILKKNPVKKFIFASSSSVYGISEDPNVTEDHPRVPVSDYNKTKAFCEDQLPNYYSDDFSIVTIRPATICGYSPRLRLDLTVNILTNHAFHKSEITVFGGEQYRPNLHIEDMTDLYLQLLEEPGSKVSGQIFNAGYENKTVMELAQIVKKIIGEDVLLHIIKTDDNRSYHISSKKIKEKLGFKTKFKISDAVKDMKTAFERNLLPNSLNDEIYYNIKRMHSLNLK